jgi:hypothetical protein
MRIDRLYIRRIVFYSGHGEKRCSYTHSVPYFRPIAFRS